MSPGRRPFCPVALLVCDQDRAGAIKMKLRIRLELARKLITVMRRVPWKGAAEGVVEGVAECVVEGVAEDVAECATQCAAECAVEREAIECMERFLEI